MGDKKADVWSSGPEMEDLATGFERIDSGAGRGAGEAP